MMCDWLYWHATHGCFSLSFCEGLCFDFVQGVWWASQHKGRDADQASGNQL